MIDLDLETIFQRFNENLNLLRASKNTDIHYLEIAPPADPDIFDFCTEQGIVLPQPIIQLYQACNGIKLNWSYSEKDEGFSIYGSINIVPLEYLLTGKIDLYEDDDLHDDDCMYNILWSDLHSEKEIAERKKLRVIEELSDDGTYVCFDPFSSTPEKLIHVSEFNTFNFSNDMLKYFGLIFDTLGIEVFRQMMVQQENFDHNSFDIDVANKIEKVLPMFNFNEIQELYFDE
jgi:hypothetical protein